MNYTTNSTQNNDRSGVLLGVKWTVGSRVIDTLRDADINAVEEILDAIMTHNRILKIQMEKL